MLFCQWQQLQCLYPVSTKAYLCYPLCPIPFSTAYMWQIVVHTSVGLGDSIASIGASYAILCLNQFALNRWIWSVTTHFLFRDQKSGSTFAYSSHYLMPLAVLSTIKSKGTVRVTRNSFNSYSVWNFTFKGNFHQMTEIPLILKAMTLI